MTRASTRSVMLSTSRATGQRKRGREALRIARLKKEDPVGYERHRRLSKARNQRWKKRNPEHVKALDRKKANAHHYRHHEANKKRMREAAAKRWAAMTPLERRERALRNIHKISLAQYQALLKAQGNRCGCCGVRKPTSKHGWMVDHCHKKKTVRGIICHHCNAGLGHAKDDPATLKLWIAYLERFANEKT